MSEPTKLPEFVDATTYMEVMNAIASDSRITLPFSQKQIGLTKSRYDTDLYPDVDWIDAITKKHAWNQRVNVNVNGGSPCCATMSRPRSTTSGASWSATTASRGTVRPS